MNTRIKRVGSSKMVVPSGVRGQIDIVDMGLTSVFDVGAIPNFLSEELAVARTTQAVCIFKYLHSRGIPTHFVKQVGPVTIRVRECQVGDKELLSGETFADHTNLELLFRIRASKKFVGRVESGDVSHDAIQLPLSQSLHEGVKFIEPFIEASTKWEDADRYVPFDEATTIAQLTHESLSNLYRLVGRAGMYLDELFSSLDYQLDDGKFEAACVRQTGRGMLIDASSLDELGVRNRNLPFGKNLLRDHYKHNEKIWYASLVQAKKNFPTNKSKWPVCPMLPEYLKRTHVSRYQKLAVELSEYVQEL